MKKLLSLLLLSATLPATAQLTIGSGTQIVFTGTTHLRLDNTDLVNHGSVTPALSFFTFGGSSTNTIGGTQPMQLYQINLSKTGGQLRLGQNLGLSGGISFLGGLVDLNGYTLNLGTTGTLTGESETSRITGTSGEVLVTANLNAPSATNPGGLGAQITSSANLGTTLIRRGHRVQQNTWGNGNTILRYYQITPTNNTGLNATLRFRYFDAELNGLPETGLRLWKSSNGSSWSVQAGTTADASGNWVEQTGIADLARYTLAPFNSVLPLQLTAFTIRCESGGAALRWSAANEGNATHYRVERSTDGRTWTAIGTLPAGAATYSFTDAAAPVGATYRLAQYELSGRVHYSGTLRIPCTGGSIRLWPNPATDLAYLSLVTAFSTRASLKLYDSKLALVRTQEQPLNPGANLCTLRLESLPAGSYLLVVHDEGGQTLFRSFLIKQ